MATNDSLREKILADFITTLRKIRKSNNYRTNVVSENVRRTLMESEELDHSEFPYLCVVASGETLKWLSNKEVESDFSVSIIGYVLFSDDDEDGGSASRKLELLVADCREVIYDLTGTIETNRNITNINVTDVITDEGTFEPFAAFRMNVTGQYQTAHDDTSLKVVV